MKDVLKSLLLDYWYWLVILLLLFCLFSCDVQKEAAKSKTETSFDESVKTQLFRKGDTVRFTVPRVVYKDTTIYRVNKQGTTLKTVYDQSGNIASIDCFASAIAEIKEENRAFKEFIKDKQSKKTEDFDSSFIFYILSAVVIIAFFIVLFIYHYFKNKPAIGHV